MFSDSTLLVNAILGSVVVSVGAWLAWEGLSPAGSLLIFGAAVGMLVWRGKTMSLVWAWSTLLLGIESLAWPLVTMFHIRSLTDQPTDEQMGTMLSAILMGLFSSVFWIAFSYGLFKRGQGAPPQQLDVTAAAVPPSRTKRPR